MRQILQNDTAFSLLRVVLAVTNTLTIVVILLRPELQTIAGMPLLRIATQYHVSLLGHVVVFGGLFLLWCWALVPHFHPATAPLIACAIVLLLASAGEHLQLYISGRYASAADMAANIVGVVFAWWLWRVVPLAFNRRLAAQWLAP
jgi:VanZ family protein